MVATSPPLEAAQPDQVLERPGLKEHSELQTVYVEVNDHQLRNLRFREQEQRQFQTVQLQENSVIQTLQLQEHPRYEIVQQHDQLQLHHSNLHSESQSRGVYFPFFILFRFFFKCRKEENIKSKRDVIDICRGKIYIFGKYIPLSYRDDQGIVDDLENIDTIVYFDLEEEDGDTDSDESEADTELSDNHSHPLETLGFGEPYQEPRLVNSSQHSIITNAAPAVIIQDNQTNPINLLLSRPSVIVPARRSIRKAEKQGKAPFQHFQK